ncbi:MAG: hypothetical protein OMM_14775, partial [Candidatus Magnetoglobus multicellularis str. Araruama]
MISTGGCPTWVPGEGYLNNMSLYGTITLNGANVVQGSTIAAFGPGGESDVRAVNDIGAQSDYFLTIRSENADKIT